MKSVGHGLAGSPLNRSDSETAREVIQSVFEAALEAEQSYVEFLAASIEFLAERYPDRWGITLFDRLVRLNVGWVESLVLHPSGLNVLVDTELAPAGTQLRGFQYARAPGCDMTTLALAELPESLTWFTESHFAALSIAAKHKPPRGIRNAHSTGVTAFLSQVLDRSMRDPSYYSPSSPPPPSLELDESTAGQVYSEGGRITVLVNRFERDPRARQKCILHYGLHCSVCNMSFGVRYGEAMNAFIHVHHLVQLSDLGTEYQVDPIRDLRPVCPNCHAVIHHKNPPLSIEEARALLK